ncbi:MAG: YegS/Rv2252/BmrU family lipid kinase [Bacteroidales bacterium]|nr:MAG: YegS/Rv2252/BmrU family lipid kinase [Bacteroidales bacterium]
MPKEKILFLINPISGTKKKDNLAEQILKLLDHSRYEAEIHVTRFRGDATGIVPIKMAEGYNKFVAVGGDGTVNEIAKALVDSEGILGIIPIGSGNGLARHLRIPINIEKAMKLINRGNVEAIDYGRINGSPFFCTCGVGFDAHIGNEFAKNKGRGFLTYIKVTISDFFNYKPKKYKLKIDKIGKLKTRAFLITVANASQYGNNAYISPKADIQDGRLDICILSPFRLYRAPGIGIRLFAKKIDKSSLMHTEQAQQIVLKRKKAGVVHYDGEPCEMGKKIKIKIVPKGLKVILP